MEPTQTNPSPETSGIPQGIPTGVFVPNNQTPAPNTVQQPAAPAPAAASAPAKEGPLDKFLQ